MKKYWFLYIIFIPFFATACGSNTPKTITHNADWKPQVRSFSGVQMVKVPPGCFMMGTDYGRRDELPVNKVCFNEPFWINRSEVTNAQFGSDGVFPGENRPRTNITWAEARDYCTNRGMRLPTEAEWEYAARGPDNLVYPWGNELIQENLVYDYTLPGDVAEVGSRPAGASWVGAMDMSGNVGEWVNSLYRPYPYSKTDGRENADDTTSRRVYRSGIYSYIDFGVSAGIRFRLLPSERDWFIGFRCAKSDD